jgi:hypothetical protein
VSALAVEKSTRVMQRTTIDGREYRRYCSDVHMGDLLWRAKDDGAAPAIVCECGGTSFVIRYRADECVANCARCGLSGVISVSGACED